jgi:hypothetical protein
MHPGIAPGIAPGIDPLGYVPGCPVYCGPIIDDGGGGYCGVIMLAAAACDMPSMPAAMAPNMASGRPAATAAAAPMVMPAIAWNACQHWRPAWGEAGVVFFSGKKFFKKRKKERSLSRQCEPGRCSLASTLDSVGNLVSVLGADTSRRRSRFEKIFPLSCGTNYGCTR